MNIVGVLPAARARLRRLSLCRLHGDLFQAAPIADGAYFLIGERNMKARIVSVAIGAAVLVCVMGVGAIANAATMTWDCNADYVLPGSTATSHQLCWTSGNIFNPDTAPTFAPLDNAEWLSGAPFNGTTAHKYQTGIQPAGRTL